MSLIDLNVHDIFLRNATIALLELLNAESTFEIVRKEQVSNVTVPFFYNFGVDGQFMSDFFFNLPPGCNIPLAEGNYERVPRGIVTLSNIQVQTGDMTNKFIRGTYNAETRDQNNRRVNEAHSARLFSLPLQLSYKIEVRVDSMNELFKIIDMFFDNFYANRVRFFQFRGTRVPMQLRFPDSSDVNKLYEFDFDTIANNPYTSVTFSINAETYYPAFDKASDMKKKNVMTQINPAIINNDSGEPISGNTSTWIDQTTLPPLTVEPDDSTGV